MQKFLKIAEQHVQWLALGLGALYLLFMGWSYGYQSDITVALGPQKSVEPGEIDATIAKGPIAELERQIDNQTPITITPPNVVANWTKRVSDPSDVHLYASVFTGDPNNLGGRTPLPQGQQIFAKLDNVPKVPAAVPVAVAAYRTMVQYPDPAFDPTTAVQGAVAPIISNDIDAVSVKFKIDMKLLAKAFNDAFPQRVPPAAALPPEIFQTMYLRVTLLREEMDASGKWGNRKEIGPLAINVVAPYPGDTPNQQEGTAYKFWARDNQELLIHPPFYPTAPGADAWYQPDNPPAAPVNAAGGAGAARGARGIPNPEAPGPLPPPAGGTFPPGGLRGNLPGYPAGSTGLPGDMGGSVPANFFNPLVKVTDDFIVAHDGTVKPDNSYRYYLQYRLINPLYGSDRYATKDVANQLALLSPGPDQDSAPTEKITIPSRMQIFVAAARDKDAHFSVFVWAPNPKETVVVAEKGDAIGPTPWTLVDIRQDPLPPKQWYVLLVDPNGNVQRRDLSKDTSDPQQKEFHERAQAAAAAAAAPGAGAPGGPGLN